MKKCQYDIVCERNLFGMSMAQHERVLRSRNPKHEMRLHLELHGQATQ